MTDLEGKELEVGAIYIAPDTYGSNLLLGKFSHETKASYILKPIKFDQIARNGNRFFSWRRCIPKDDRFDQISVIRVSQIMIDKYNII